ncbi:amidohydrolase family protein [Chloroflexota bacterium]
MPVIDFRFRPPSDEFKANHLAFEKLIGFKGREEWYNTSLDECVKEMEEIGLIGVVLGRAVPAPAVSNDHLKELADRYPGRFIPLAGVDPSPANRRACQKEIDRVVQDLGMRGIYFDASFLTPPLLPNDRRLYPIYAQCADLGVTVCLGMGLRFTGSEGLDPRKVEEVATDFPELKIVLGHGSYPFLFEAVALAFRHNNVWISPDAFHFRPFGNLYVEAFNSPPFSNQYLYASSYPYGLLLSEGLGMKASLERWKGLGWNPKEMDKLLYGNAARVLGLD